VTIAAEGIMGDKYRDQRKQRKLDGDKPERPYDEVEGGGARQYDSGRNPEMQVQRSDRQGSGKATQQRPEDR
jgi:hypothetical protein